MTVERTAEHNVSQFPQVQQICNEAQLWRGIGTKTKRPDRCRSGRPWTILFVSPFGVSPSAHLTGPLKRERRDGDIPEPRPAMIACVSLLKLCQAGASVTSELTPSVICAAFCAN